MAGGFGKYTQKVRGEELCLGDAAELVVTDRQTEVCWRAGPPRIHKVESSSADKL